MGGVSEMDRINISDFQKLDLRVGLVQQASPVEGADRLIKMEVDIGEETPRTILAGIRQYYQPEDLVGKKIIVLTNLEPRKMRGLLSDGMLLAASTPDYGSVKYLTIESDLPPGSKIS